MARKTKRDLYNEARELYCYTDLSLSEIAEQLGVNVNTLYKYSTQEKWVLLKESKVRDAIKSRNIILSDRKLKNIKFYETVLSKCEELIREEEIRGREISELVKTFTLAEDRYFLLSKERLEQIDNNESSNESILDELANL